MGGRRLFQAAALLITLAYCSLLAYQNTVGVLFLEPKVVAAASAAALVPTTKASVTNNSVHNSNITLNDIFISVKTTKHYQNTRLPVIFKTWFRLAKEQTWFFTDTDNESHQRQTNGHMVNTQCPDTHEMKHLCCKMAVEYDFFLDSGKKWFCHFDDDNYVNVPRLLRVLNRYSALGEWYLGRNSINEPVRIASKNPSEKDIEFRFATGGAGFCLSRPLAYKMQPFASGGRILSICQSIKMPDDVTVGFIVEHLMKRQLIVVNELHSHLEPMKSLDPQTFRDQVSFSFSYHNGAWNVLQVPGFDTRYDPSRFLSLHCFLFPHFKFCPR